MSDSKLLLSVKDLVVKFRVRGRILTAIRGISLDIMEDECIAVVGESGSGKSVFTKTFAGMLDTNGFIESGDILFADDALAEKLRQTGQPWAVSVPAQVAGVACAGEGSYLERSRALVRVERERLIGALTTLGLRVVPSDANYLLLFGPEGLGRALLARGVMVRACDNFVGLGPGWYRVAVRTPEQNALLVAVLREVL